MEACNYCGGKELARFRLIVKGRKFCDFKCQKKFEAKLEEQQRQNLIVHLVQVHHVGSHQNLMSMLFCDLRLMHEKISVED